MNIRAQLRRLNEKGAAGRPRVRRKDEQSRLLQADAGGEGQRQIKLPLCAVGDNANKARVYDSDKRDADHVTAWSRGGDRSAANCEMLCQTNHRAKGNRLDARHAVEAVTAPGVPASYGDPKELITDDCIRPREE